MSEQAKQEFMTPDEIAAKLRVSRRRAVDWMRSGEIPGAFKVGREWRISIQFWEKFLAKRSEQMIDPCEVAAE